MRCRRWFLASFPFAFGSLAPRLVGSPSDAAHVRLYSGREPKPGFVSPMLKSVFSVERFDGEDEVDAKLSPKHK